MGGQRGNLGSPTLPRAPAPSRELPAAKRPLHPAATPASPARAPRYRSPSSCSAEPPRAPLRQRGPGWSGGVARGSPQPGVQRGARSQLPAGSRAGRRRPGRGPRAPRGERRSPAQPVQRASAGPRAPPDPRTPIAARLVPGSGPRRSRDGGAGRRALSPPPGGPSNSGSIQPGGVFAFSGAAGSPAKAN